MREIIITISKDGNKITTDALGFSGSSCETKLEKVIGNLGKVIGKENKMEFYEKEQVTLKQRG